MPVVPDVYISSASASGSGAADGRPGGAGIASASASVTMTATSRPMPDSNSRTIASRSGVTITTRQSECAEHVPHLLALGQQVHRIDAPAPVHRAEQHA